jgi:hypothetical protein
LRDLTELVKTASRIIPRFNDDHLPLYPLIDAVFASHAAGDHKRAVKAQCHVAIEHYAAIIHLVGAKMGLAAYGLTRNLFEVVLGTLYLAHDSNHYDDFLRFGTKIHYELVRDTDPSVAVLHAWVPDELDVRKNDYDALVAHFGKANNWSKKSVRDLAPLVGFGQLYRTYYKAASSIAHGNSFILLKRLNFHSWEIEVNRKSWDDYSELAGCFAYLTVANLFVGVDEILHLGYDYERKALTDYIQGHPQFKI